MNFFNIFGLEEKFDLDKESLELKYLALQKIYHQDTYGINDPENTGDIITNISKSLDINSAYKTLKDDFLRAHHILNLKGIHLNDDQESRKKIDQEFLIEMLETMEFLENITEFNDLIIFRDNLKIIREAHLKEMSALFKESYFNEVSIKTLMLKYYDNIIQMTDKKIQECF
ncbi:MAG: Fe-S protein assembly co-chaperone HscB [Rickettsiaceae bacterium]|nr:Fe-S protein assembly co-chaperone HscB [Rickettsiaceae bacterium]